MGRGQRWVLDFVRLADINLGDVFQVDVFEWGLNSARSSCPRMPIGICKRKEGSNSPVQAIAGLLDAQDS